MTTSFPRRPRLDIGARALLALCGLAGCASRATLTDTLHHFRVGNDAVVVEQCETEAARWRDANPEETAALSPALETVERAMSEEWLLIDDGAGFAGDREGGGGGRAELGRTLREEGLGVRRGGALRSLAADLLSDAPLRILRAAEQAAALGLRPLVPHLVANVYSDRPLPGAPGPLADATQGVRVLATKTWCARAVRRILLPAP